MVKVPDSQMKRVQPQIEWLGARFKEVRNNRGLRAKDVADWMEISYTRIIESESGKEDMKVSTFFRLCAALGITPEKLFKGCPNPKKSPARHGQAD